jgi:hypothetical protein
MWISVVASAHGIRLRGFRGRWYDALLVELVELIELIELEELYRKLWVDMDKQLNLGNSGLAEMIW